jgi:hypothetical protein
MPPPPNPTRLPLVSPVYPLTRGLRLPTAPPTRPGSGIIPIYKACHNAWLASKVEYAKRIKAAKANEAAVGLALIGKEEKDKEGEVRDFGLDIAGPSGRVYTQQVSTIGIVPPGSSEMVWITPQQYLALKQSRQAGLGGSQAMMTPDRSTSRATYNHTPETADATPTSQIIITPPSVIGEGSQPGRAIAPHTRAALDVVPEDDEPEYIGTRPPQKKRREQSPSTESLAPARPMFAMPALPTRHTTPGTGIQVRLVNQAGSASHQGNSNSQSVLPGQTPMAPPSTPPARPSSDLLPTTTTSPPKLLSPVQLQPRPRLGRPLPHLPPDLDFDLAPRTSRGHLLTEDVWDLMLTDAIAAESPLAMRLERDRRARHTEWVRQQRELTYDRLEKESRERRGGGRTGTVEMRGESLKVERGGTVVMRDVSVKASGRGRKRDVKDE